MQHTYFIGKLIKSVNQSVSQTNKQTNKRKYKQINIVLFNVTKILEWAIKCWNRIIYFYFFAFYYQQQQQQQQRPFNGL